MSQRMYLHVTENCLDKRKASLLTSARVATRRISITKKSKLSGLVAVNRATVIAEKPRRVGSSQLEIQFFSGGPYEQDSAQLVYTALPQTSERVYFLPLRHGAAQRFF